MREETHGRDDHADIAVLIRRCDDLERALEREVKERKEEIEDLERDLDKVADQVKTARGGLIVLMSVGGVAATLWTDLITKVAKLWSH